MLDEYLSDNSFKPCYKWNTFNTYETIKFIKGLFKSFKPCYKWNTFNTFHWEVICMSLYNNLVLNLIISGIPSIQEYKTVLEI